MKKPKVGQTLYSLNIGNATRNRKQKLTPVTVTKVGRKYFTCAKTGLERYGTQYHLSNWKEKTNYSPDSYLYEDPQIWKDEKEAAELCDRIRKAFDYSINKVELPLDDLRKIDRIITNHSKNISLPKERNKKED